MEESRLDESMNGQNTNPVAFDEMQDYINSERAN